MLFGFSGYCAATIVLTNLPDVLKAVRPHPIHDVALTSAYIPKVFPGDGELRNAPGKNWAHETIWS